MPPIRGICGSCIEPARNRRAVIMAMGAVGSDRFRSGRNTPVGYCRGMADAPGLTHVDASGAARMVDVSAKDVTAREARAAGRFVTTPEVIALLRRDGLPKGDALAVARIAGIAAAKRTPDLVPLCHPVALHGVTVDLSLTDDAVEIVATTRTADRTGVEMEALTSVVTAGLALYDMVKAVDRSARLTDVRLLEKSG